MITGYTCAEGQPFQVLTRVREGDIPTIFSAHDGLAMCPEMATVQAMIVVDVHGYVVHTKPTGMKMQNQVMVVPAGAV